MTATLTEPRSYVERLVGRQLSEAEQAIDVALLDQALAGAKNRLERAIHVEISRGIRARGSQHRLELLVTDAMRKPLEQLAELGRVEGWNELERLGYDVAGRQYVDSRPAGPGDLDDYLRRGLTGMQIRIEDELVFLDVGGAAQSALVRAALAVPGARDIASRMVSTALIGGLAETFDTVSDLIAEWEYTAILDGGTCDVCRPLNGTRYATLEELFRVLPNFGPNPRCLGGGRCRCRAVPVNAAAEPRARLTADLTDSEKVAIGRYTSSEYEQINGYLRQLLQLSPTARADIDDVVDRVDRAIDKASPLRSERLVWRAFSTPVEVEAGDVFDDLGFMSTSATNALPESWAGPYGDVWEITLPAGTKALDLNAAGAPTVRNEREILLGRGVALRIDRVEERVTSYPGRASIVTRYVFATVIPG